MSVYLVGDAKPVFYEELPVMLSARRFKHNASDHIGKTF